MAMTAVSQPPPIVGTATNSQHSFLTFPNYLANKETPQTAQAYYAAVNPGGSKVDFRDWLVNAGFIRQRSDWRSTGQQIYTTVAGDYGPNKVNAFAHIIILNAADLGFIRNQYIRCKPDCKTKYASIYTYLENYPVPENAVGNIALTQQAVNVALERRAGRIADVAFEWAPAANGTSPTALFGQLYSFVVHAYFDSYTPDQANRKCINGSPIYNPDGTQKIDELLTWPNDQAFWDCNFKLARALPPSPPDFLAPVPEIPVVSGDYFAPELDALGTKQHPGVCFICHGGNVPGNVAWPTNGNVKEFRMLPADVGNAIFGVDDTGAPLVPGALGSSLTQAAQEVELKKYNQTIVITQGATPPKNAVFAPNGTIAGGNWTVPQSRDDQGTLRPSHGVEVIFGWYAGVAGDKSMSASVQNHDFVPVGWQSAPDLYLKVVAPSCRSCHMNREQSLDLGTLAQFDSNKGNVEQLVFQPECDSNNHEVKGTVQVMPLAKLTWDRFWNGVDPATKLAFDAAHSLAPSDPNSQPYLLKQHFGYTATSYCAHRH